MPDTNDAFDLPRWHDPKNSSDIQYFYPQSTTFPTISPPQHRLSHLLDLDSNQPPSSSSSSSQAALARSASYNGPPPTVRARRSSNIDRPDLAVDTDRSAMAASRQPQTSSFYNPATAYHIQPPPPMSAGPPPSSAMSLSSDSVEENYYTGSSSLPSKRIQPQYPIDPNTQASRSGRSPMRVQNTALADSYQQQTQYSPTLQYSYGPPQQSPYHNTHNRNLSHPKQQHEPLTPPVSSSYASPPSAHPGASYPSPFAIDTSNPHPPRSQSHLTAHSASRTHSISNPSTPLSYMTAGSAASGGGASAASQYYSPEQSMAVDPPPKRRPAGFRRVRTVHDLHPRLETGPSARRVASDGTVLSPLRQVTTNLVDTYHICNPQFRYESAHNPRRVLTKPSKPAHNDGYDNEDYDYILYVNDWLGNEEGHKYLILDILGQGTFGQVVKCQNMKTHEIVAVKIVKNKPAYFNQSMMEVTILELLNKNFDPNDEHHILRLRDSFIHKNHLCLVFELLSSNLYELIKQNQFQGLSTQLVKVFMAQLLDALSVLKDARLIHCDLKPENILLKSLQSPQIKVIDFGSACHERQTVYTYIQSRFYRSPEVLLGMSYNSAIDMWSLGCIAVELFLGLPLFPGTSEYNQLTRIIDMLGMPPLSMLNTGKQVSQFFDTYEVWNPQTQQNEKKYRLKSIEQYSREHNTNEQPGKQYFKATTLPEIINTAPIPQVKSSRGGTNEVEKGHIEMANRAAFFDFCQGLLNLNPVTRWTPQQARLHPFITGEKFTKPFVPDGIPPVPHPLPSNTSDSKRPYGGLVPSQPKGTRAYQDAATYNHQLAQHQAYTAQAQAAANQAFRNPYITPQHPQQHPQHTQHPPQSAQTLPSNYSGSTDAVPFQTQQHHGQHQLHSHAQYGAQGVASQRPLAHQSSAGQLASGGGPLGQYGAGVVPASGPSVPGNAGSGSYYPNSRARANTINQMDAVPPALARLQHMNQDVIGGRNALTPVLNRDDAMREWERRQQGGKPVQVQPYPQLEYLQQQAEMAAAGGLGSWTATAAAAAALGIHPPAHNHRYPPPPSKLSQSYHPQTLLVEDDNAGRRDAILSNVRTAARGDVGTGGSSSQQQVPQGQPGGPSSGNALYGSGSGNAMSMSIASPPQAYGGNMPTTGNRYVASYSNQAPSVSAQQSQHQQGSTGGSGGAAVGLSAFDSIDRRTDIGNLYAPMQPDQYHHPQQQYASNAPAGPARHIPPQQAVPPSFYAPGVTTGGTPTGSQGQGGPQRNPFSMPIPDASMAKDVRRGNTMDAWPR